MPYLFFKYNGEYFDEQAFMERFGIVMKINYFCFIFTLFQYVGYLVETVYSKLIATKDWEEEDEDRADGGGNVEYELAKDQYSS